MIPYSDVMLNGVDTHPILRCLVSELRRTHSWEVMIGSFAGLARLLVGVM